MNCKYQKSMDQSQPQLFKLEINDSQTIVNGDLIVISAGRGSKAAAAASKVFGIAQGNITTGVRATQTLTFTGIPVDNQTVTIGSHVYELTVDGTITAGNIPVLLSDVTADIAVVALANAINNNASSDFVAVASTTADTVVITAKNCGTNHNGVATTETCTNAAWGDTTTASGTNTSIDGITQTDNDYLPVLELSDKAIIRMDRVTTSRKFTRLDLFTSAFDIVVSGSTQKVDAGDTTGGFLIPVAYDNTQGHVDVVVKSSALWNA